MDITLSVILDNDMIKELIFGILTAGFIKIGGHSISLQD